jgi:hypothetical protein
MKSCANFGNVLCMHSRQSLDLKVDYVITLKVTLIQRYLINDGAMRV